MNNLSLLAISCNWNPYYCYNAAGHAKLPLPAGLKFMRVMCIGRVNQALILKAFEYGADGVILLGCKEDDCRYGPGPRVGQENVERARRILELLGIGQARLIEASFGAHEKARLASVLNDFAVQIHAFGPNPVKPNQTGALP